MTISEEILIIANRLANSGKKPTVALVKPKLSKTVPLALLIDTLKHWQHQPDNTEIPATINTQAPSADTENHDINHLISKAIAPLQQEINELKNQIASLKAEIEK